MRQVLGQGAQALDRLTERREGQRRVCRLAGHRRDCHGHLGDDPERPLAPDDEVEQSRPGGAGRGPHVQPQGSFSRRQRGSADDLVDPAIPGRCLTRGPGRHIAADGRFLVALRVVAEREPVRSQRTLHVRTAHPRLEDRRPRDRVDRQHPVEPTQVDRHRRCERPGRTRHSPNDTRAPAEGDDGEATITAYRQQLLDLGRVRGGEHDVRCVRGVPFTQPAQVEVGLPGRVLHPGEPVSVHVCRAYHRAQRGEIVRREPALGEADILKSDRAGGLRTAGHPELTAQHRPGPVRERVSVGRIAPPVPRRTGDRAGEGVLGCRGHVKHCYTDCFNCDMVMGSSQEA